MSALLPFLTLDQTCDQVQTWVTRQLTDAGFRVVQTFDLQVARLAHPECSCPHHGTDECNCEMVVLLIYRKQEEPATLVIHGQDSRSWLSLANQAGQHINPRLEAAIRHTLTPHHPAPVSSIEVANESQPTI
jgi:hypothetical protein